MNRRLIHSLALAALACLALWFPAVADTDASSPLPLDPLEPADIGGTRGLVTDFNDWLTHGGDGGSPWPIMISPPQELRLHRHADSAVLGDVRLFAWSEHDGRDREIRLVRLHADGVAHVSLITRNALDDAWPRLAASPGTPVLVTWRQATRDGVDLMAVALDREGAPATAPVRLERLPAGTLDAAALPLQGGLVLTAWARPGRSEVVIEARLGSGASLPVGTAPADVEGLVLSLSADQRGHIGIDWTVDEETTASVEADARGRVSSARYRGTRQAR